MSQDKQSKTEPKWPAEIIRREMSALAAESGRGIAKVVQDANEDGKVYGLKVRMPDRVIIERKGKQHTFWLREDGRLL